MTLSDARYDLICFDFWWTLFTSDPTHSIDRHTYRVQAFLDALESPPELPDSEAVSRTMVAEWGRFNQVHKDEHRTLTNMERAEWLASQLGCRLRTDAVDGLLERFEDSLFISPPEIIEGIPGLLSRLAATGTPLAIISDTSYSTGKTLRSLMQDNEILRHFDVLTFSDEVGRAKPHASVFEQTLAQAGVAAGRAIHIGDREDTDVAGAKDAGLDAVLFLAATTRISESASRADHVVHSVDELAAVLGL